MRSLLLAASTLLIATGVAFAATETYTVDAVHSFAQFKIKHKGLGYTHGRFNDMSGSFLLDEEDASKSLVSIKIKADSVDTNNAQRDGHLKGSDFFAVKEFPTITFKSTAVKKEGEVYTITGKLTLHGVTKEITLKATRIGSGKDARRGYVTGFEIQFTVKRSDYGMKNMIGPVGDEVAMTIAIEAVRK